MRTTHTSFILKLKERNPESWDEFVSSYHSLFVSIIRRNGVPERDVGDILQEVFVRLYQVLPRFNYQRSKGTFNGWLKRVVVNTITDWRRKHSRQEQFLKNCNTAIHGSALQRNRLTSESVLTSRVDLFEEAVSALRDRVNRQTWACFEEHALKGRNANDVASELSTSVNAVYVNTSRVMSQIREYCLERIAT